MIKIPQILFEIGKIYAKKAIISSASEVTISI